jgi:hypothetical protein
MKKDETPNALRPPLKVVEIRPGPLGPSLSLAYEL